MHLDTNGTVGRTEYLYSTCKHKSLMDRTEHAAQLPGNLQDCRMRFVPYSTYNSKKKLGLCDSHSTKGSRVDLHVQNF